MKVLRRFAWGTVGAVMMLAAAPSSGQVVINEIVKEQINPLSGAAINPDTREFIELYNAGNAPVNIGGWTLSYYRVSGAVGTVNTYLTDAGQIIHDVIPPNTMLAPGDFWVLGHDVENLDQPISGGEIYPDSIGTVVELRTGTVDSGAPLVDALAYDTGRTGMTNPNITGDRLAQTGHGFHGRPIWGGGELVSLGRWYDGLDRNDNGRDFGILLDTPGMPNMASSTPTPHVVPDVDALAPGAQVAGYYSPFVNPRAVDPTVLGPAGSGGANINPKVTAPLPAHASASKSVIVWDETGGGNAVHGTHLTNKFDIYAYIDPTPIVATGATGPSTETTGYGIGTIDPFYGTPDPEGVIFPTATTYVQNSSAGVGWMFQKRSNTDGTPVYANMYLIDFGAGGDSRPAAGVWDIKAEIDVSNLTPGWYHVGIEVNGDDVTATFNGQTTTFQSDTDVIGSFYAAYRTGISNFGTSTYGVHNPARFIQYVAPPNVGPDGDFNDDGIVDAADYVMWRKLNPNNATLYGDWRETYDPTSPGSGGNGSVPEPASVLLVALALAGAGVIRRHGA